MYSKMVTFDIHSRFFLKQVVVPLLYFSSLLLLLKGKYKGLRVYHLEGYL